MFLVINVNKTVDFGLIAIKHQLSMRVVLKIKFITLFQSLAETLHKRHVLAVQQRRLDFRLRANDCKLFEQLSLEVVDSLVDFSRSRHNDLVDDLGLCLLFCRLDKVLDQPVAQVCVVRSQCVNYLWHCFFVLVHQLFQLVEVLFYLL